jgi:mannose-6-phosphate isomerase-like protein (cupin superfamily)
MTAGTSTSLKYYKTKNEVLYVREGKILVEYDSEKYHYQDHENRLLKKKTLLAGDVLYVQSNCPYKITALKDSEIFEIGDGRSGGVVKIEEL